jgi:hypothetical protein
MNSGGKLAAFALVIGGMVAGGAAIGAGVGPIEIGDDSHDDHTTTPPESMEGMDMGGSELPAGGLLVSQDGYTLVPVARTIAAGTSSTFAFTITGPAGRPVTRYEKLHTKELHLVLVSGDLATYHHVHPTRAEHGTWSVELPGLPPGPYRAFADFQPSGSDQLTLGVDLTVPGSYTPAPVTLSKTTSVAGFDVTLTGDAAAGEVSLTVRRDGQVVTTEEYLGAAGHLVAIRDGDLAYLHVHPISETPDGPVRFGIEVPSAGTYGLYFDFQVNGQVHTAQLAIDTSAAPAGIDHGGH